MGLAATLVAALCLVGVTLALVALTHVRRLEQVRDVAPPDTLPAPWPRVSIVVPARNEAGTISTALASKLEQDYPELEVVAVDDRSTDGTGDAMGEVAGGDPRLRVVSIEELPSGWLGKTHALAAGAEAASGEWLLLSDADVHLAPDCLRRVLSVADRDDLDFLTVIFEIADVNWLVEAAWSVGTRLIFLAVDPRRVADPSAGAFAGAGSFNLVRASALEAAGGLEGVRLDVTDDMALGMLLKRSGARCAVLGGRDMVQVAAYRTLAGLWRSMEKNGVTRGWWSLPAAVGFTALFLLLDLAPLVAIATGWIAGRPALALVGAASLAIVTAATVRITGDLNRRWAAALLWPLGSVVMATGVLRSIALATFRGGIPWRGTFYEMEELREAQNFRTV